MKPLPASVIAIVWALLNFSQVAEFIKVKFTKLECEEYDKSFASFDQCRLRAISRNASDVNIHMKLHQVPINNITLNGELFQKGHGYRPFMYNTTLDFCRFMKNSDRFLFWKLVFNEIIPYSNVNHTCPYDHDIIVNGLILKGNMFNMVPFPANDYMFRLKFAAYKIYRIEIRAYVTLYG